MKTTIIALCLIAISAAGIRGGLKSHKAMLEPHEIREIVDLAVIMHMEDPLSANVTDLVKKLESPLDVYYTQSVAGDK